jgi:hypothetical protein
LENPEQTKTRPSPYIVDDFVKEPILKQFYMYDMNQVLENYELGKPKYKPKLLEQIFKMEEKRAKQLENNKILQQQNLFNNPVNACANTCITTLRNEYEKKISDKNILINELLKKIKQLTQELLEFKTKT